MAWIGPGSEKIYVTPKLLVLASPDELYHQLIEADRQVEKEYAEEMGYSEEMNPEEIEYYGEDFEEEED